MLFANNHELIQQLLRCPDDASVSFLVSKDVPSGGMEVGYDLADNRIIIVSSIEDQKIDLPY